MSIASTSTSKVLRPGPAPSAFTTLLHKSKFASYDPFIKQVYSAPPASAHRGTMKECLHYGKISRLACSANGVEPGESQARFIRRWEELGVLPKARAGGDKGWERTLGPEATEWLVDSEHCDWQEVKQQPGNSLRNLLGSTMPASLLDGRGYTKKLEANKKESDAREGGHLVPNLDSMNPAEFKRFLNKCRSYDRSSSITELKGKSLYDISQNTAADHHRQFLQRHTRELFGYSNSDESQQPPSRLPRSLPDSCRIEQKPHPTGALLYSHPSRMTNYFTSPSQPGLVVQELYVDKRKAQGNDSLLTPVTSAGAMYGRGSVNTKENAYFASFAGMTAILKRKNAAGKKPLLNINSEEGVNIIKPTAPKLSEDVPLPLGYEQEKDMEEEDEASDLEMQYASEVDPEDSKHEARMRIIDHPTLNIAPKVVGYSPEGLKGANLSVEVIVDGEVSDMDSQGTDFTRENPFQPGSREYITGGLYDGLDAEPPRNTSMGTVPLSMAYSKSRSDGAMSELLRQSNSMTAKRGAKAASGAEPNLIDTLRGITKRVLMTVQRSPSLAFIATLTQDSQRRITLIHVAPASCESASANIAKQLDSSDSDDEEYYGARVPTGKKRRFSSASSRFRAKAHIAAAAGSSPRTPRPLSAKGVTPRPRKRPLTSSASDIEDLTREPLAQPFPVLRRARHVKSRNCH
ncbi:mitochondrial ribosomal protein-domain-containing protein [Salix suchowensis]|nr:mitochondrial ribosomal protein-domain-containing protein [Salix suchowensis]